MLPSALTLAFSMSGSSSAVSQPSGDGASGSKKASKKRTFLKKKGKGEDEDEVFDSSKLHTAVNAKKVLKYLKREGVDTGAVHDGDTPLHAYVRRRDKHKLECLMAFLVNAKYNVNSLNEKGESPLHLACDLADLASAKALIAFDADINQFNSSKETPLDIAAKKSHEIADILTGIGGMDGHSIIEALEIGGSLKSKEKMEQSFERMFDPGLLRISEGDQEEGEEEGEDKIPEDGDERYMTPDVSVQEMAITSFILARGASADEDNSPSQVNERNLLKENPFFPKIDENEALKDFSSNELQPQQYLKSNFRQSPKSKSPVSGNPRSHSPNTSPLTRSPRSHSPNASPLTQSPRSHSPNTSPLTRSPRSHSPINTNPQSRSRSPSPLTEAKRTVDLPKNETDFHDKGLSNGGEEVLSNGQDESESSLEKGREKTELEHLERLKKNYAMAFHAETDGSDDTPPSGKKEEDESAVVDDKKALMKKQGFVNYTEGDFFERLDTRTQEVLERGIEDSLGDEGYAAWLQYREIQRLKRDREALMVEEVDMQGGSSNEPKGEHSKWLMVNVDKEHVKSPNRGLSPEKKPKSPLKHPKHVLFNLPPPTATSRKPRLRPRQLHNAEMSMTMSVSTINPNMSIMESGLGKSVAPLRMRKKRSKRGHRILCLDGGGVKGLVQIEILRKIEELAGAPISELFDWIVGTSTGGIVILGTVYGGLRLEDLRKVYFEMKDKVFKRQHKLLTTACDTEALETLLKKVLGTTDTMERVDKPKVMITAVNKSSNDLPLVFFNNCFGDEFSTQEVWKVARCTSAAPVFFKEFEDYIDGGVVANNPCNFALTHIKQHLKKKKKEIEEVGGNKDDINTDIACLVSVGCGIFPSEPIGNTDIIDAVKISNLTQLPAKLKNIVTMLTTALTKSEDQANMCRIYCEELEIPFYRFSPLVGEMVGTAETDDIKLCESVISTKKMLYESQEHLDDVVKYLGHTPVPQRRITS